MITRKLSKLRTIAAAMPAGYLEDVLAGAIIDEAADTYQTSDVHWEAMRKKYRPQGMGDVVARMAAAVGVKPCGGCKRRQAALNRILPMNREAAGGDNAGP